MWNAVQYLFGRPRDRTPWSDIPDACVAPGITIGSRPPYMILADLEKAEKALVRLEARQKQMGTYAASNQDDTIDQEMLNAEDRIRDLHQELVRAGGHA